MYGSYAKMILKYFLAEGAVHKNHLLAASLNENPWDIVICISRDIINIS